MIGPPNIASAVPAVDWSRILQDASGTIDRAARLLAIRGARNPDGSINMQSAGQRLFEMGDFDAGAGLYRLGQQDLDRRDQLDFNRQFVGAIDRALPGAPQRQATPAAAAPAAAAPGAGGDYFSALRAQESAGDPNARNPRSSATGLYQFTDRTWSDVVNSPEGRAAGLRLDGRGDPQQQETAVRIFTAGNEQALRAAGHDPTPSNLYMAHFLGRAGGPAFLGALRTNPDAPATSAVGAGVAQANPTIFFRPDGSPRTVREVYALQTRRFGGVAAAAPAPGPVASEALPPPQAPVQVAAAPAATATDATTAPRVPATVPPSNAATSPAATPSTPAATPIPPAPPAPPVIPQSAFAHALELARLSAHPRATEGMRQVSNTLLQAWVQSNRPTDEMREYLFAVQQGERQNFTEWSNSRRRSAATQVNQTVENRAENAESAERGKQLVARYSSIAGDLDQANQDLFVAQRLAQILSSVDPGARTALLEEVRQRTGIAVDDNADNVQAASALINFLAPRLRVPGSGAQSDMELRRFEASLPSLRGTVGGNEMVLETIGALSQHRVERARIATAYMRGEIAAAEADRRIEALPNPFQAFRRWQSQNAVRRGGRPPRQNRSEEAPAPAGQPPDGVPPASGEVGGVRWRLTD